MKKLFALALALSMTLSLAACGSKPAATAPDANGPAGNSADPSQSAEPALDYPVQPITMMVAWPAGGGSDLLTRAISADAPDFIGVNMNVTNRDGAGGTIGFAEAVDYEIGRASCRERVYQLV